jgi:hypothetical protein
MPLKSWGEHVAEAEQGIARAQVAIAAAKQADADGDEAVRDSRSREAAQLIAAAGRVMTGAAGPQRRQWGVGLQLPRRGH